MKIKAYKILLILLIFQSAAFSQITETDTAKFSFQSGINGSFISGNVERFLLISSLNISMNYNHWAFISNNVHFLGSIRKIQSENDLLSKNFFYLSPDSELYPYLMFWFETNKRREISNRFQIGPGISYSIYNKKDTSLKLSLSLTYESTYYDLNNYYNDAFDGETKINTYRGTLRLFGKNRLIENRINLLYEFWYQHSLDIENNYRFYSNVVLDFPVSSELSFKTSVNFYNENFTVEKVKESDLLIFFGFSFLIR